ncbi:MAG: tRNA (adenosine(37)-N6)-threonylcarbamoyltransferase complex transferase subunit TsaD [Nitrosopumilus sp.]|nr:tRNA (adenosine(37)-N6)-threonylcarbamoyltransferase complex transferase subunit TsaD [Nitrosopumilus sp.]
MRCLGIESTAHTFSCSIIDSDNDTKNNENDDMVLSEVRDIYKAPAGWGIHPRDASKHHALVAPKILKKCLDNANIDMKDIDLISYSAGPGLGPCLRIGAIVARSLASFYNIPLIPVNHALGHIELGIKLTNLANPLTLLVSGGHTMILVFHRNKWRVFGETLDITLGQLFDQIGRSMGFASPCGNKIEELSNLSDKNSVFSLPYVIKGNDVSFSGLLTAVKTLIHDKKYDLSDICFSLQETAFSIIVEAVERALSFTEKKEFLIVGGVSANKRLSQMLQLACEYQDSIFKSCPLQFCGDNGTQIAWTGLKLYLNSLLSRVEPEKATISQSWRLDTVDILWR